MCEPLGMTLDELDRGKRAVITAIDWTRFDEAEGKRLRALGLDEGARVAIAHRGVMGGRDPVAVMVGRMTIAVRRAHAVAMQIDLA